MLDVVQRPKDACVYEIRQKGQIDPCYVVVPNPTDLVKSHLMFAVREEVEVLKERIAELMERINQLEVENTYLRAQCSAPLPPSAPWLCHVNP
ncbi:Protein bunched, class 1/class 3/D/E isoforms [Operophtera brumata]|uniref:Protein bunched, class 1/class 3/D/E isoforms n=1 Tax=Operophtera brumata TaxID=104452 RepID=A0A0L7LRP3_OPEBR|nr:Protein bunched, class 1/class 3/D/E isoforms [Operophtera brumata]